jgi:hypothetical protein
MPERVDVSFCVLPMAANTVLNYREQGEPKYYKRDCKIWFKKEEVIDFVNRYKIQVKEY